MASAARVEWQRVECTPKQLAAGEQVGECWSLVTIPAVMQTVSEQVCVQPASTRYEAIPAEYAMKASAPPPAYWEWRRSKECEVPLAAAAPCVK